MKTIYITEKQIKEIKKKKDCSAMAQVGGEVNSGIMLGITGGGVCEGKENIETWYRGFDSKFGEQRNHLLWLTTDLDYAKEYGDSVMVYKIDGSKCDNGISDVDCIIGEFDYLDGPSEDECRELLENGVGSYCFMANDDDSYCMCLWDKSAILGQEILKNDEMFKEGAEPESDTYKIGFENDSNNEFAHVINEEKGCEEDIMEYLPSVIEFMSKRLHITERPEIHINTEEQDGLFIRTGYYEPNKKSITIFIAQRHIKDCLRSFCHEFIHFWQDITDPEKDWGTGGNLDDDKVLRKLEGEAYLKGNLLFREWTEWMQNKNKKKALNESIIDEKVDASDIDLSSFDIKDKLNPKFWKDGHLDSRIRMKLLDLADDFLEYMGLEWIEPEDVIMTGSLANFNWNKQYSDIDLHILVDYKDVDEKQELVANFFKAQKELWNQEHKDLKIYGFPVEVYVQDTNEKHNSSGIYSLDKDKWLTEPDQQKLSSAKYNKDNVRKMVAQYMNVIDEAEENYKNADDSYKLRKLKEKLDNIFTQLKKERTDGLKTDTSEYSEGNITYKMLRRRGYIAKIFDLKTKIYDKMNSLL